MKIQERRPTTRGNELEITEELLVGPGEDNTVKLVNKSRNKKANRWLGSTKTRDRLCASVLMLVFALDMVYATFRRSTIIAGPSLLDWIKADGGTPSKLIDRLFNLLDDLEHTHWTLLRFPGDWTDEKTMIAFCSVLRLIGGIKLRMIDPFELPPWCFRYAVDPTASMPQKTAVVNLVRTSCTDCLDEFFGIPIKEMLGNQPERLLEQGSTENNLCRDAFSRARVSNTLSENRLGRCTSSTGYRAGGYLKMGNICAKHVNAEHASQWAHALQVFASSRLRLCKLVQDGCSSAWQYFMLRRRRANPANTMMTCAAEWRAMSDADQNAIEEEFRTHKNEDDKARADVEHNIPHELTPLGIGDNVWAVREDVVRPFCTSGTVSEIAQRWDKQHGHIVHAGDMELQIDNATGTRTRLCGETWRWRTY